MIIHCLVTIFDLRPAYTEKTKENVGFSVAASIFRRRSRPICKQSPSRVVVRYSHIHLCDGLNDKNLVKPRKRCFVTV